MDLFDSDLLTPIGASILAGGLIGFEREYRGAPAGFRTHILVCLSSTLLMLAAVHQIRWLSDTPSELVRIDPVRMAHGILTGIGFLCGGVIFREGFTIRGLTTAASLWTTSALGALFGVGFFALALAGALATLAVLAAVSVSEALLPQRQYVKMKVRYRRGGGARAERLRALLAEHGLKPGGISHSVDGDAVTLGAVVRSSGDAVLGRIVDSLVADPEVERFDISPRGE